jgi:uncharacterized protein (DUF342 family)
MVDFVRLQHIIKEQLEQDRAIHAVEAEGPTLEEAVASAATLLNIPVRRLEYEVTERGFEGVFGTGKKDWKIKAYERAGTREEEEEIESEDISDYFAEAIIEDVDGDVFVQLQDNGGAYLKISAPVGKGKRASEAMVAQALEERQVKDIDQAAVSAAVKAADGEYVQVGIFDHIPQNDSMIAVEVPDQEMKAFINVTPPGPGGCDITLEGYKGYLVGNRVYFGVDEDFLKAFADRPSYRENVQVAEGARAVNGRDAYIQYNFETDQSKVRVKEGANGQVDFKELNIIQNVVEGQPLAVKIIPEKGVQGTTVTGKPLPAKDGKDIPIPLGNNVHLGDDQATIIADINGQVVEVNGKVNVEPVYTVQGDVDLKTGNIMFLGTVIVNGNVTDGFSVKAVGNIEINGTVEKADLDAEGDIIVHQGITGKGSGVVRAGKSVWAKFIENAVVDSGGMVVASDGLVNCHVDAYKSIVCYGKRAAIVGGRFRASEEINAKILGSPTGGAETICEVGVDPRIKETLAKFAAEKEDLAKQLEDVQLNMQTLISIKKQRKSLPADKEAYLRELAEKRQMLLGDLKKNGEGMEQAQEHLTDLKTKGRVSASAKVYPGVKIIIRDVRQDVQSEYRAVTFVLEDGLVRVTKYEEPGDEVKKGPDGYSTN